jgi:CheY-like chemotaxis protein
MFGEPLGIGLFGDGMPHAYRLISARGTEMKKILFEGNEECRKMLACIIRYLGYEVIQTESGFEGIARAGLEHPELIFISVDFPEMRRLDAITSLKNNLQTSDIPIVVFPPWDSKEATEAAVNAGATGVLKEPFTLDSFRQVLQKYAASDTGFRPEDPTLQ